VKKFLIQIAAYLDSSSRYKKTKEFFYNLLENDNFKYKKYFDSFMIFIVLSSVAVLLYDVKNQLGYFLYIYDIYVVTTIFIVEYLLRFWVYNDSRTIVLSELEEANFLNRKFNTKKVLKEILNKKLEYVTSPFAIIDLLAILPAYRPLRILRIFMLFRLFKILRYTKSVNNFLAIIRTKKFEIITLLLLVGFITFIGGAVIYVFEYQKNQNIQSFFDAVYWSLITISTVGYGDISPVTYQGRVLTMFLILAGIGFISFATSIIASAFTEKLQELKTQRIENEAHKLNEYYLICGFSKLTELVANNLKKDKEKFIILDVDEDKIEQATSQGFLSLKADITKQEILKLFDFAKIKKVFILTEDDIINTFLTLSIKSYASGVDIIAIVNDERNELKMQKAGATYVLNPTKISALFTSEYIGNPVSFEVITAIFSDESKSRMDEIEVLEGSFLENELIGNIDFEHYKLILIGVVKTKKSNLMSHTLEILNSYFYFNPHAELLLEKGDVLIVIGDVRSINYFKNDVQKSSL
jgi:voltage-gated potassium channel